MTIAGVVTGVFAGVTGFQAWSLLRNNWSAEATTLVQELQKLSEKMDCSTVLLKHGECLDLKGRIVELSGSVRFLPDYLDSTTEGYMAAALAVTLLGMTIYSCCCSSKSVPNEVRS